MVPEAPLEKLEGMQPALSYKKERPELFLHI